MNKFTKLFVVVLTLALLVGAVVGVTAYAEGETTEGTYEEKDLIISYNVSYADYMHLYLAIDTTLAADYTCITADVTVNGQTYEGISIAQEDADTTLYGTVTGHVLRTPGVAAKDMLDDITVTVYYSKTTTEGEGEEAVTTTVNYTDTVTYSVAQYFFERLYKNGIVDATAGTDLSRKELYTAALNYGAAAQKLLTSDTKLISDIVYLTSPSYTGMIEKGYELTLDASNYEFTYYDLDGATGESDITGAAGVYLINETTVVEPTGAKVSGPAGSANFEGLTVSDTDLDTANAFAAITGAAEGATGLSYVGAWSESHTRQNVTVGVVGSKYIRHEITTADTKTSHTMDFVRDTSTEGNVLVFQARLRVSFSAGYTQNRFYKGRFANGGTSTGSGLLGSGGANNLEYHSKGYNDSSDWYTYRVVAVLDGTTLTINGYRGANASSLDPTPVFTKTTTCSSLSEISTFTMMLNTSCIGYVDYDYVYFNTVADLDAVNALTETVTPAEVTLAPNYLPYDSSIWTSDVIVSGATFSDSNPTSYTKVYGRIDTEGDNKYVSFADDNSNNQMAQLHFTNSNDLTDMDTLTFKVDLRLKDNPNGPNTYSTSDLAVQIRVRNANSSSSANTGFLRIYAVNGKITLKDYSGSAVSTDIDAGEWITVTVSYTSNAAKCQVTITSGEKSANAEIAATSEAHQVAISAITNIGIYTSTGFMGIFDVDNVSIVAE